MRIGFDARMIKHPGIGRYISCLLPEIIKQAPDDDFVLFGPPGELERFSDARNVSIRNWEAPIYTPWEQFFAFYYPMNVDLLHVPHFNIPVLFRKRMVVTIHDLIYLLFPESVNSPLAKHYVSFMIRSALEKAEKVITVSDNTRADLMRLFGEEYSGKIRVIHEAAGRDFRKINDKTRLADVMCRYRLSEKIILYVGSVKPHKNVATLIKVFTLLKEWGLPHQLVICGRWNRKEDHLKDDLIDRNIRYIGEIPLEDLVVLYNMADVLVHLSLYEGFGLTALEAMRCGTPVVTSDVSSLPEVAGEAAITVSPLNVEQIADTVYNVVVNERLREGMIAAGLKRIKQFSWEKAARETLKVYHSDG